MYFRFAWGKEFREFREFRVGRTLPYPKFLKFPKLPKSPTPPKAQEKTPQTKVQGAYRYRTKRMIYEITQLQQRT